jgi:hypothetical protein
MTHDLSGLGGVRRLRLLQDTDHHFDGGHRVIGQNPSAMMRAPSKIR